LDPRLLDVAVKTPYEFVEYIRTGSVLPCVSSDLGSWTVCRGGGRSLKVV